MKILLDNCVPRPFERLIPDHEVIHCSRLGWERLANGRLLSAAEDAGFPILITVDKSIPKQQNMAGRKITLIFLRAVNNDLETLKPMAELVRSRLDSLQPGSILTIYHPDWQ